ncbi:MAG: NnrS family protein, partial [Alphaproteobacteria bacterium]
MRATGFRPFFFLAAVWGLCVVGLTALAAAGSPLAGQALPANPFAWHGREMVFGYVPAVMAGFLLTAIPNWTGRLPLAGWRLWLLVGLWFGGRVAGWAGEWTGGACSGPGAAIPPAALVAADLAFLTMLVLVVGRELVAGRNWRNLPVLAGVMVMLLALALWHGSAASGAVPANVGLRLGLAAAAMMIALIGGRIVPSFTTNWLKGRGASGLPRPFGPYDRMVLLATGVALAGWVIVPASASTMGLAALAAGLNIVRLARWRGAATAGEPLLWVLHLGYGWLVLALALIALGA